MQSTPTSVETPPAFQVRPIMNLAEAADYLRVSVRQIERLRQRRELRAVRVGRRLVFRRADLDHYVELQAALAA